MVIVMTLMVIRTLLEVVVVLLQLMITIMMVMLTTTTIIIKTLSRVDTVVLKSVMLIKETLITVANSLNISLIA